MRRVLNIGDSIGSTFWSVLGWTLIWAVAATFSNYILGMILAIVINRKGTRCKAFWRFCFVLSAAVPQFVSLLLMRTIFSQNGIVNTLLLNAGIIEKAIPFWSNTMLARVMVVVINIWVGIPFTMLQVTGVLQNIPADLYVGGNSGWCRSGENIFLNYTAIYAVCNRSISYYNLYWKCK